MRGLVAIAVVANACYDPHPPSGGACAPPDDACPDGMVCYLGACIPQSQAPDGRIDATSPDADPGAADARYDGPVSDVDGDGWANSDDNCPADYNPDQHNEDGDARGDACDGCPHVFQNMFGDADGDGVDSACDPRPGLADSLERFIPFDVVPTDLVLSPASGAWTPGNDTLRQVSATGTHSVIVPGARSRVVVEIGGDVAVAPLADRELKLIAGRTAGNVYTACTFDDERVGAPNVLEIEDESATGTTILGMIDRGDQLAVGPFVLRIRVEPDKDYAGCHGVEGGNTYTVESSAATALSDGTVEIRSNAVQYEIRYIVIYAIP
jgi:hypothetical protein